MSRRSERLVAVAAIVLIVGSAVATILLLSSARTRGVEALEASQTSEVAATARSFNQRQASQLNTAQSFLSELDLDFTLDGGDQAELDELLELFEGVELRTGFYLLDPTLTITAGALLEDPDVVGTPFPRPELVDLLTSPSFFEAPLGGILPVGEGLTTSVPVTATVYPVFGADPTTGPVGYFIGESDVSVESDFVAEITELASQDTDVWRFLDQNGAVVASSDLAELGMPLADDRIAELPPGLHDVDGELVVVETVPASGWRVVFSQERDEFEEDLTGPLETAGAVLVVVLLVMGGVIVVVLVRQLRAAREEQRRLRELNASQEEFISIVSHELRTPVAGVLGFLQTSLDHWDAMGDQERRQALQRAASNARRLQGLTRDVLDTESLEQGRLSYVFDEGDLRDEVRAAVEAARDVNTGRAIEIQLPSEPVPVRMDPDRIQQVLGNLLDNADKNTPIDHPVDVRLEVVGDAARITVRDHGPGLDPAVASKVFDKFVRGRADSVSGTGLGLYIARRVVEAHDGRIWVEPDVSPGAAFHVEVPLSAAD